MSGCCDARGCDQRFGSRFARRMAARYRKRGLDDTARRMIDLLGEADLRDVTVLEIGGGVGEIAIELLTRGASTATNLELSPAYEPEAQRLLTEAGLTGRVHRRLLDIATTPDGVEPADVVVMHRVVCCYPDHARLLGAVADRTRHRLLFSHPVPSAPTRAVLALENAYHRLAGHDFRIYAHPPAAMSAVLAQHGLQVDPPRRRRGWQITAARRPST